MPNSIFKITGVFLVTAIIILSSGCHKDDDTTPLVILNVNSNGYSNVNTEYLGRQINSLPMEVLSPDETQSILFMREEEKLARDINVLFYQKWGQQIFDNISVAEQTHMVALLLLINKYNLSDPVGTNPPGIFTNDALQTFYTYFETQGNISVIDALKIGAAIEEIDIRDFNLLLADNDINNTDILLVYTNLVKASRNHLRSFVKVLNSLGVTYSPAYLSPDVYTSIINSPMETGH